MTLLSLQAWLDDRGVAELRCVRGAGSLWYATAWRADVQHSVTASGTTVSRAIEALLPMIARAE